MELLTKICKKPESSLLYSDETTVIEGPI